MSNMNFSNLSKKEQEIVQDSNDHYHSHNWSDSDRRLYQKDWDNFVNFMEAYEQIKLYRKNPLKL